MAENLNYTPTSGTSWCYGNAETNCDTYGRLYNWETAKKACPVGWHLPSDAEWKDLEMYQGMTATQANALGERGNDEGTELKDVSNLWNSSPGSNTSGFSALPGGSYTNGAFDTIGRNGYWWTSTLNGSSSPYYRSLYFGIPTVSRNGSNINFGFSVRCLKDAI